MKKAALLSIPVVVAVVVVGDLAEAQQLKKVPRIGFLFGSPVSARSARIEPFRQGVIHLGCSCTSCCCVHSRGAATDESATDRISKS